MISTYFNITVTAEWVTFFGSLLLLNKKTGKWRLFILLLFLSICAETAGWYMTYILKKTNNALPFNLLVIITMVFFNWILAESEVLQKIKKAVHISVFFFTAFAVINLLFIQGYFRYNYYTEIAGDFILLVVCCLFFYNILAEENFRDLFRYEYFWLAAGLIFTAMVGIVLYIFPEALQAYYKKTHINVYGYINYGINLLLYTSLIIAFVCRRKNMK
jgi:hypothetical protein